MQTIPDGDLYSCTEDDDHLTHSEAADAVEAHLDNFVEKVGETVAQTMARDFPDGLAIYVFKRRKIDDREIARMADRLIEYAAELWDEADEFGGPDHSILSATDVVEARPKMLEAVSELAKRAKPWSCEVTHTVTISAADVAELLDTQPEQGTKPAEANSRLFPILGGRFFQHQDEGIPWGMMAPHQDAALRNHSQTLERLAERGGLNPAEALAVLDDRPYRDMDPATAHSELYARAETYRSSNAT